MSEAVAAAMQRLLHLGDSAARSSFAQVFGSRMHYLDEGSGAVIVLLHGGTGGGANWFRLFAPLAARHRVLAPDLPGFGLSAPRNLSGPLGGAAATLFEEWLRQLGVTKATVVGTSFGGLAALRLAQRASGLVERLFLLDSAGLDRSLHVALRLAALPLLGPLWAHPTRPGNAWTFRALLTHNRASLSREMQRALTEYLYLTARNAGSDYLVTTLRRFAGPRGQREYLRPRELSQLSHPTAVVVGEHDPFFSAAASRRAAERTPHGTFRIIPDVGHSPNWEAPDQVFSAILEHMAR